MGLSMGDFVPKGIFLTKGVGVHKQKLSAFELALRDAGIEKLNLVTVSSIFPPHCKIFTREQGMKQMHAGQIAFCVLARQETDEPNRLIASSIGLAMPKDPNMYGYLSEHHSYGQTGKVAGEYAEDLAATMLATTLGVDFDPNRDYDTRKEIYKMAGAVVNSRHVVQSAEGNKDGQWTCTIAAGVFLFW